MKLFKIDDLKKLQKIKIGKDSFTQVKLAEWEQNSSDIAKSVKSNMKSFHILNCEYLEMIEIGQCSFSDFSGVFELRNLPKLLSLVIGDANNTSRNFHASSFVVRGTNDL